MKYFVELSTVEKNPNGYGELFGTPSILSHKDKIDFTYETCVKYIQDFSRSAKPLVKESKFIFRFTCEGVIYRAQLKTA